MRCRWAVLGIVLVGAVGCGDAGSPSAGGGTTAAASPAITTTTPATVAPPTTATSTTASLASATTAVAIPLGPEPPECASVPAATAIASGAQASTSIPVTAAPPTGEVGPEDIARSGDVGRVIAYGCQHLDEWAGVRVDGSTIVVSFTGHATEHEAAITDLLTVPAPVHVEVVAHSAREIAAVRDEVEIRVSEVRRTGQVRSYGGGIGVLEVALRADARALADELIARHGDRVAVTLGLLRYPGREPGRARCEAPTTGPVVEGLTATVEVDGPVASGADFRGRVVLHNDGTVPIAFASGEPLPAVIVDATGAMVGTYDGGIAGVGRDVALAPGDETTLPVLGGTASCDPALGFALPPGTYGVLVAVSSGDQRGTVDPSAGPIVAGPGPLVVTP